MVVCGSQEVKSNRGVGCGTGARERGKRRGLLSPLFLSTLSLLRFLAGEGPLRAQIFSFPYFSSTSINQKPYLTILLHSRYHRTVDDIIIDPKLLGWRMKV